MDMVSTIKILMEVAYIYGSSPTITNCLFQYNSGGENGGAGAVISGAPIFTNDTFYANTSGAGGGLYITNSSATITNCTFFNNVTVLGGR